MEKKFTGFQLFMCGAVIAAGLYFAFDTVRFLGRAEAAPGVVTDVRRQEGSRQPTAFITFETPRGKAELKCPQQYFYLRKRPGDHVTVLYDPANPARAKAKGFWSLWAVPVLLISMGVFIPIFARLADRQKTP